jgi:hypothetical protein
LLVVLLAEFFQLVFQDMNVLDVLGVAFVLDGAQQPFQLFGLPVQLVLPLHLLDPPSAVRSVRLHNHLPDLAVLLIDLLQVHLDPRTAQELPELPLVNDAFLDDL